jgi:hypothetical protein
MITLRDVYDRMIRLAGEHPDRTVSCQYFSRAYQNDELVWVPCCIVGNALAELGITCEQVNDYPGSIVGGNLVRFTQEFAKYLGIEFDSDGLEDRKLFRLILSIQSKQDEGETWSNAVRWTLEY